MRLNRLSVHCLLLIIGLQGCGDGSDYLDDLNKRIVEIKSTPKAGIPKLPPIKPTESFILNTVDLHDPFRSIEDEILKPEDEQKSNGISPDTARKKEELEYFPLDDLKMVGTISIDSTLWALIRASDKTVNRVRAGSYMGKNYGKIVSLTKSKIELLEIVPDKPGTWKEQQSTLVIAE